METEVIHIKLNPIIRGISERPCGLTWVRNGCHVDRFAIQKKVNPSGTHGMDEGRLWSRRSREILILLIVTKSSNPKASINSAGS